MTLKLITRHDEDRVLELLTHFYEAAKLPYGPLDLQKARSLVQNCSDPQVTSNVLIGWEEDQELQGLIAGQVTEVIFNLDRVATELVWWVEPMYRKGEASSALIGAFEYWAEYRGCKFVQMAGLQNDYSKVLGRYYNKRGYVNAENTYVKEIGR